MLTTATMVMPLGTDTANVRPASADRTDVTDTSFAKSFEESSALAVAPVPQAVDQKAKGSVVLEESVAGNDRGAGSAVTTVKGRQNGNAADEIQKESANVKNLPALPSGKVTPSLTAGVTPPSTGVPPQGGKTTGSSPVIETKGPAGSLSAESKTESKDVKNVDQKNIPTVVDAKTDAADATVDLDADGDASVAAAITGNVIKPQIEDTKTQPILEKSPGAVATEKETKGHDGVVKTGKPDKPGKTEEKKTPGAVVALAGVDIQGVVAAMVAVAPVDGTKPPPNAVADEETFPSVGPPATGQGIAAARTGARGKGAEAVKKSDSDNGKTIGPVVMDDSATQKSDVKESKTPLSATKPAVGDNATPQSTAGPMAVSGTAHAGLAEAGVGTGGISGGVAAHVIAGGNVQAAVSSPHAAAGLTSTAMDSGAVVDAGHKTFMATPTSLEVGVANGIHGWLKIRADMTDGGVVNASLSTATSSGQEMLHRELPLLTAYLQNERVAVNTVVVQPPMTPGADLRGFQGAMAGDQRGLAQQSGGQGGENRQGAADSRPVQREREGFYSGRDGVGRDEVSPLATRAGGGSWLNVRA
ncbi:MAG TPA: hypothetical protein VGU67_06120 [Edaphobacter sp.]|nr:hypothetical protein [Edaphobacter sp.]